MGRVGAVALVGVAALVLGACGSDTDPQAEGDAAAETTTAGEPGGRSAEDQAFVDEVVKSIEGDGQDESFPAEGVECWVGEMVDGIGVDQLSDAGFTAEAAAGSSQADLTKLSDTDRKLVGDSFVTCIDLEAVFTESMAAESGSEELPTEVTDCLADLDWDTIEAAFGESIVAGTEDDITEDNPVMTPLVGCMMLGIPAEGIG
ncbi:MAG: hypothetical protein R2754_10455 [Microthrixaceae bacterium]